MSPAELEEIRERSTGAQTMPAGHLHAHEDRRCLLAHVDALQVERDAARAEVERLKEQIAEEQDLGARCQEMCGECKGLCGPDEDALSEQAAQP